MRGSPSDFNETVEYPDTGTPKVVTPRCVVGSKHLSRNAGSGEPPSPPNFQNASSLSVVAAHDCIYHTKAVPMQTVLRAPTFCLFDNHQLQGHLIQMHRSNTRLLAATNLNFRGVFRRLFAGLRRKIIGELCTDFGNSVLKDKVQSGFLMEQQSHLQGIIAKFEEWVSTSCT